MSRKYQEIWAKHTAEYGKVALLMQVGSFFEIYDTEDLTSGISACNVRELAELCQLSLTVHPIEGDKQTLFGGFPEHSLQKFERILVQAGFTVVVIVQRKGSKGTVEERIIDHISSPGCFVDGVKERRLVGCVLESIGGPAALQKVLWAAAALDIATGQIWFVEGSDRDRLHQFLCMYPPSELVLWTDGLPSATAWVESLRTGLTHTRCLPPSSVAIEEATLTKFWTHLDWIHRMPQARRCLSYLMNFAADHVPSALVRIGYPEPWVPTGEVRLGNAALEQLCLVTNDSSSLLGLMDKCRSVGGRRLMRSRLMRPISDIAELERRLNLIDSMTPDVTTERNLRSLYDISRLYRRVEIGTATMNDMSCLLRSYESTRGLIHTWSAILSVQPAIIEFIDWILAEWNVEATVEMAHDGIPTKKLPWNSSEVDAIFAEGLAIRAEAEALCKKWSGLGRGEQLYLDDAEGGGFRITGTKRRITSVLATLKETDPTATTTAYKTSAVLETAKLTEISARHRKWWNTWVPAWNAEWSRACGRILERGDVRSVEKWCAELDVAWTVSQLSKEWLWNRPTFVDEEESSITVENLRHPILERILTKVPYVSHSLKFDSSNKGLLLYGMNASGKSSLMKALGLCVLLAQAGFPVPANCRLSPFTAIFTRILGNDNLWAGQSSFAVEMMEFREILHYADNKSLVLGDELCSGTESLSATALVAAGIETLAGRNTKFVFATHLHELASFQVDGVRAVHLKVHYDPVADLLIYDRSLAEGAGSALYGLEVCRALDLPEGYLDRATVIRKTLAGWKAPHQSSYSSNAILDTCAVCGSTDRLEMHHIHPQKLSEGVDIHTPGNLVCLCAKCHDDHHGGTLIIRGWQETSEGRRLLWDTASPEGLSAEVIAWVKEQKQLKIRVTIIQRMVKQIFGTSLTEKQIRAIRI